MKKVLVTGGAGFIGTHLVNALVDDGYAIRILDNLSPQIHGEEAKAPLWPDRADVEFVRGTVTDEADWIRSLDGVDAVIHLAAETGTGQSMYQVARYYDVNVQGTALLFDILANRPHKVQQVLLASSRSVYGEGAFVCESCGDGHSRQYPETRTPDQLASRAWEPVCIDCSSALRAVATREDDRVAPASIYAASKLAQEDLVRVGCTALGIGYGIFRLQNVYGEGQSLKNPYTGILSIFSTRVRLGLVLPIFEDGEETRDFVHVEDVVNAFMRCLETPDPINEVMNVGTGEATPISCVAEELCKALDAKVSIQVTGQYRVGDIRHNFADVSRLAKILGYKPRVTLQEGLGRFVKWVGTQPVPQDLLDVANKELQKRKLMG